MGGKMALFHEGREDGLAEGWRLTIEKIAGRCKCRQQCGRHNRVPDPQTREERLIERAHVNYALVPVEALQRGEWWTGVAEFAGVIVIDNEAARVAGPSQQFQAP